MERTALSQLTRPRTLSAGCLAAAGALAVIGLPASAHSEPSPSLALDRTVTSTSTRTSTHTTTVTTTHTTTVTITGTPPNTTTPPTADPS